MLAAPPTPTSCTPPNSVAADPSSVAGLRRVDRTAEGGRKEALISSSLASPISAPHHQPRPHFPLEETLQPLAAGSQFGWLGWVAARDCLQQPHAAEREAVPQKIVPAPTENQLGAAAANIQQQQRRLRQLRVSGHSRKPPGRLLLARNDFDLQSGRLLDRSRQLLTVHRLTRGAGGDDADRDGLRLAGHGGEGGDSLGRGVNRLGLQAMRLVETLPEAGLFALLANRPNLRTGHLGHQQLHRVGADINDRAADGLHVRNWALVGRVTSPRNTRRLL